MKSLLIDTVYILDQTPQKAISKQSNMDYLSDLIPLMQTLSWIIFITFCVYFFRKEIIDLRAAISTRLKDGTAVKLGALELGEIRQEVKTVKDQLALTNDKISRLFITTMGLDMYNNLKKLHSANFGQFQKSKGLVRELYYLRDIGYIEVSSITDLPNAGDQLSKYVVTTPLGSEFVQLREQISAEKR